MKVVLISTPSRTYAPNYFPPLGVMYLASYLRNQGHDVKILDVAKSRSPIEQTISEITTYNPDLIAISAIITAYRFVKQFVRDIKEKFPTTPVVIGGHIALDNVEMLFEDIGVDYAIQGYGELKIAALIDYLSGKGTIETIPGVSYKKNGSVVTNPGELYFKKIDDVPLPAYDLIDMEHYVTALPKFPKLEEYLKKTKKVTPPIRYFPVIGALGCTDKCSFCVHEFDRVGLKLHSINYVIENIRVLYNNYGVRIFILGEDLYLINSRQAQEFVEAMNKNFPDAFFHCSTRADFVTPELIKILENSNCFALGYGFESGSDYILDILGKRMTGETNIRAFKWISSSNITAAGSLMVGTPGETKETIDDTLHAIQESGMTDSTVFFTTPYPGSRIYRWCIENNYIKDPGSYLDFVSDRDAVKLSINFTPYPDIIVKMMRKLVENALEINKTKKDASYHIPYTRRIFHHTAIPFIYEGYFKGRYLLSHIIPRYRKDRINYILNKKGTLKISCDDI